MEFLERLVDWAHSGLQESDAAKEFLRGRGSSAEQWVRHRIGYFHGEFDPEPDKDPFHGRGCFDKEKKHLRCDTCRFRLWASEWTEDDDGNRKQVLCGRVRGSVVLPLTSYSGALVGFQTRHIKDKVYDNFMLSRRPEAYGFGLGSAVHHLWATKSVAICEGPFDDLVLERLVTPAVFALTTSSINQPQMTFLKRFVKRIFWCGDLDRAGRDGLDSLLHWHRSEFDIVDVSYPRVQPKDKDPGDYWWQVGDRKFADHFRRVMV
jgi:DNA primase